MVYVFGFGFLAYLVGYTLLMGIFVWVTIAAPLLWHRKSSKKLVFLIPVYLLYQQYLNVIQLWCVFAKLLKRGVTVQYGPRRIHTV
jgi:hypothetical protein